MKKNHQFYGRFTFRFNDKTRVAEVWIDPQGVADAIAYRAFRNKSGEARALDGAIVVAAVREAKP